MRSKLVALVALVGAFVMIVSGPALGGEAPAPTVSPESGLPGSDFTVSGTGCATVAAADVEAAGTFIPQVEVTVDFPTPLVESTNADPETGEWSIPLTVPEGTPPGTYAVSAECLNTPPPRTEVEAADFDYPSGATFTVTEPVEPVVPPAPLDAVPEAPAPAPVAAAPRLTG